MLFATGLTTSDEEIRPKGIWADERIMYDAHEFCGDSYAAKAIRTALEAVDIELDPYYGCSDTKHKRIGIIEWTKRVFYAQGALDLCLIRLRKLDDARAASRSRAVSYPRLVIEGFDRTTPPETSKRKSKEKKKGKNDFIVTPDMIHAHWTRRGAHTDHFDHPLVFAEPGLRYLAQSEADKVVVDPAKAAEPRSYLSDDDDEEQASSGNAPAEHTAASSSTDKGEDLAVSASSASSPTSPHGLLSRPSLLALGRFVVQQTSNVKNLSLSGLFHELLSSSNLGELRHLSIGPLVPPDAAAGLLTSGVKLPKLRKLRVCGDHPTIEVGRIFAGEKEGLESLEELHWDFGYANVRNAPGDAALFDVLNTMRGAVQPAPPSSEEAKDGQHRKAPAEKSRPAACRRYIEARMHPTYVTALLSMASPETRAAWTNGQPAGDADHCLHLCESRAWEDGRGRWRDHKTQKYDVLRRETKQWWEDSALESQ